MTEVNQEIKLRKCLMCEKLETDVKFQPSRKYCIKCNSARCNQMMLEKNPEYYKTYMRENWRKYHKPKHIPIELQKKKGRPPKNKDNNTLEF